MVSSSGWIRKSVLGLADKEADFGFRGFRGGDARTRQRIERVIRAFLQGYNGALEDYRPEALQTQLEGMPEEVRGFAYEAAGMAVSVLDHLTFWHTDRFHHYVNGPDKAHTYTGIAGRHRYMAYIGAGLALARLARPVEPTLQKLDPFFCWLAMDGYGFHQGFFSIRRYIDNREVPERFTGYTLRAFDQGLGRSLWFVEGADHVRIPATIATFNKSRRADLWSGVGLACAYAGGVEIEAIRFLARSAGEYLPHLAQGIAFAAMTRHEAGNPTAHTEMACQVVWRLSLEATAQIAYAAKGEAAPDREGYEKTRHQIQHQFSWEGVSK